MKIRKVLYQSYTHMVDGPFKYIEHGYVNGLREAGYEVAVWDGADESRLDGILSGFRPDAFVGFLRQPKTYQNFPWATGALLEKLVEYRNRSGLRVAVQANPDLTALVAHMDLTAGAGKFSTGESFVSQPAIPSPVERELAERKVVDVIRHHYSRLVDEVCFQFWKEAGVTVVPDPLAADTKVYRKPLLPRSKRHDISYIGGWWPFKGKQMDRFLLPMKVAFGGRLEVFGRNWPSFQTRHISDEDYLQMVLRSRINLVFHEPILVQGVPIHVNERIFKLYALGAFAICDNNNCLHEYFEPDEIVIAENPEDMIEKCRYFLEHPSARREIAKKGRRAVLSRHTYRVRASYLVSRLSEMS